VNKFSAVVELVKKKEIQVSEILRTLLYSQSDKEYNQIVCFVRGLKSFFL